MGQMGLLLRLLLLLPAAHGLTHGWDCISCKSNSMLVSNFGTFRKDINLSDPWWIDATADSHAAIILNVCAPDRSLPAAACESCRRRCRRRRCRRRRCRSAAALSNCCLRCCCCRW